MGTGRTKTWVQRAPNGCPGVAGFLLQVDVAEIVLHEADDPDAFVDFLDADALTAKTVETLIRLRCMQMRRKR